MNKIKVSADTVLAIIKGIMQDEEINYKLTDTSAPEEWQGKNIQDILNVYYYTFKHRPMNTEDLVVKLFNEEPSNVLYALTRAFCILSLSNSERVWSKNVDVLTTTASLEYWIQTDKVKLLEEMFEDMDVATNGIRIPVQIGEENRQALVIIGTLNVTDIEETTEFGEMSVCEIDINFVFYPNATSISDYNVKMFMPKTQYDEAAWVELPISSISMASNMTQKSLPLINTPQEVGNINLSRVKSIVLTFDGYKNRAIDYIADLALKIGLNEYDNNALIKLLVTRGEKQYEYDCVLKDHSIIVQEGSENETHSLTLDIRGIS